MPPSSWSNPNGIVIDTNVLSLLASANRLDLLSQIISLSLFVSPQIYKELTIGVQQGFHTLQDVLTRIDDQQIQILTLNNNEQAEVGTFPNKLARGEAEAITLCRKRNLIFLTHDRKAANYCEREEIPCIRFKELLTHCLQAGLLTQTEINGLLK